MCFQREEGLKKADFGFIRMDVLEVGEPQNIYIRVKNTWQLNRKRGYLGEANRTGGFVAGQADSLSMQP